MASEEFNDFLLDLLKDTYNAEQQITKALPKMIKAVGSETLKKAFASHLKETEGQIVRLEKAFDILGEKAKGKTCAAMKGLIEEAKELMDEDDMEPPVLDAGLILAAQKVEHYEIAAYGALRTFAGKMGQKELVKLFDATLAEEKAADAKLTQVAEEEVNVEAIGAE
jgi:ferritin-like metal-binding protein YciE